MYMAYKLQVAKGNHLQSVSQQSSLGTRDFIKDILLRAYFSFPFKMSKIISVCLCLIIGLIPGQVVGSTFSFSSPETTPSETWKMISDILLGGLSDQVNRPPPNIKTKVGNACTKKCFKVSFSQWCSGSFMKGKASM